MKKSLYVVLACILFAIAAGAAAAADLPVDFTKFRVSGAGEWSTQTEQGGIQFTQSRFVGGAAALIFEEVSLPADFSFSAELGCIEGNNPDQRPYMGLYINYAEKQHIIFTFRPSQKHWEVTRNIDGKNTVLGTFADPNPWPWDLQEWRTMQLIRKGKTVEAYVNGKLIISVEDDMLSGGSVGFYTYSTAAVFKNAKLTTP